jgi:hypothetical protein
MAVRVRRPDRDDRDARPGSGQKLGGSGRGAAVVSDFEHVYMGQAAGEQDRIHVVLGVARKQESATAVLAEEHD